MKSISFIFYFGRKCIRLEISEIIEKIIYWLKCFIPNLIVKRIMKKSGSLYYFPKKVIIKKQENENKYYYSMLNSSYYFDNMKAKRRYRKFYN